MIETSIQSSNKFLLLRQHSLVSFRKTAFFLKIPTPYRNLTASFLCFQLQFVSTAPSPRLVCSDNSSPRYTWYRARGCRRKWRSCLSCQLWKTCQSTCLCLDELQKLRIMSRSAAWILWQNQKRDSSCFDLLGCTCKTRGRSWPKSNFPPLRTCQRLFCLYLERPPSYCK